MTVHTRLMDLLNKVMVIGNLTRDPELRKTANGTAVANLGLAVAQSGGGHREETPSAHPAEPIYLDVVLWERTAEIAEQYLKKGSAVLVEGRLQMDTWQDEESGKTRRKVKISGERMRFLNLGSGRGDREDEPVPQASTLS